MFKTIILMNKISGIFFLLVLFMSCSSDLDLEQPTDLKLNPSFVGNFAYFDFQANQFVTSGVEQNSFSNELFFDIVKYESVTQYLTQADFYFEFSNTISRAYSISVNFLDVNNVKLYSFLVAVPAYSGSPILVKEKEIFQNTKLDLFRKTHKVAFQVEMLPGVPLTSNSLGSIKMRSSATIYLSSK